MKAYLATSIIGSFAFDKEGILLENRLFPKKVELIVDKMNRSLKGEILEEEMEIVKALKSKGIREVIWDKKKEVEGIICTYNPENKGKKALQEEFRKLALQLRWANSQAELNDLITKVHAAMAKEKIGKPKKDIIIINAVRVYDEIEKTLNVLSERLKEWYGIFSPDTTKKGNEEVAKTLSAKTVERKDKDIIAIQNYAKEISQLYEVKKKLKSYIEDEADMLIPNTSAVAGHLLAARLMSHAGGLEKLAKLPSSTIQLLGSEKALFRHLKGKGKSPKFGILFAHPYIQKAPREKRGKVARIISLKLTLATRIDCYTKEDRSEKIGKELEEQVNKILGNIK